MCYARIFMESINDMFKSAKKFTDVFYVYHLLNPPHSTKSVLLYTFGIRIASECDVDLDGDFVDFGVDLVVDLGVDLVRL